MVTLLLSQIESDIRIQGRTAYISFGNGSPYSDVLASAVSLLDLTLNKDPSPIVEQLANFVALGNADINYGVEQACFSLLALSSYDKWKGNNDPDLHFEVTASNNIEIVNGIFTSALDPPLQNQLYFEEAGPGGYLSFSSQGQGEASVVMGLNFVPLNLNPEPIYRGILVEKAIQLIDQQTYNTIGSPITEVAVGSIVRVTIQITIPDDSPAINIIDPVPGGLEPLNQVFYDYQPYSDYLYVPQLYFYQCFYNAFSNIQYFEDKVTWNGYNLIAGTYTVSYVAIANVGGIFALPPTLAYDARQPELMGLSAAGTFTTKSIDVTMNNTQQNDNCLTYNHTLFNESAESPKNVGSQILIAIVLMILALLI